MTTESPTGKIFGAKAAVVIGTVMVAGFAALSVQTARERSSRTELEAFQSPTAVGEPVVVTIPENDWKGQPILQRDGVAFFAKRRKDLRDTAMLKAGSDDSGKISIYRRWRKEQLEEAPHVKLAPGKFLEISDKPSDKAP